MAEHGGYRRPQKPAAVSPPGALSQRTDGRPQAVRDTTGGAYGEAQAFREMQQSNPVAGSPGLVAAPQSGGGIDTSSLAGMGDPTAMPNVPVTDGADAGMGAGSDALGLPSQTPARADAEYLKRYLPVLIRQAQRDDAPPSLKKYVRTLIAQL